VLAHAHVLTCGLAGTAYYEVQQATPFHLLSIVAHRRYSLVQGFRRGGGRSAV
jgi:hypothetical protein